MLQKLYRSFPTLLRWIQQEMMRCLMVEKFGYKILIFLAVITLIACAGQPMRTELPISHPANPRAQATPFTLPPDIFHGDIHIYETRPTPDSSMTHNQHEKPEKKLMNHRDMIQKGGKTPSHLRKTKSEHQHKEQKQ